MEQERSSRYFSHCVITPFEKLDDRVDQGRVTSNKYQDKEPGTRQEDKKLRNVKQNAVRLKKPIAEETGVEKITGYEG